MKVHFVQKNLEETRSKECCRVCVCVCARVLAGKGGGNKLYLRDQRRDIQC